MGNVAPFTMQEIYAANSCGMTRGEWVAEQRRKRGAIDVPARFRGVSVDVGHYVDAVLGGGGLYLFGSFGTGKTATAYAVASGVSAAGKRVEVSTFGQLLEAVRSARSYGSPDTERQAFERYCTPFMLMLDDLGKERPTSANIADLWRVVDERSKRALPIVATSNYSLNALEARLTEGDATTAGAIASRLREMCAQIPMLGADMRAAVA